LLLRGRCRPTVTSQAFMLGCGTEKVLLSRGNNVYPEEPHFGILLLKRTRETQIRLRPAAKKRLSVASPPPLAGRAAVLSGSLRRGRTAARTAHGQLMCENSPRTCTCMCLTNALLACYAACSTRERKRRCLAPVDLLLHTKCSQREGHGSPPGSRRASRPASLRVVSPSLPCQESHCRKRGFDAWSSITPKQWLVLREAVLPSA
jgi:hypothetical protein